MAEPQQKSLEVPLFIPSDAAISILFPLIELYHSKNQLFEFRPDMIEVIFETSPKQLSEYLYQVISNEFLPRYKCKLFVDDRLFGEWIRDIPFDKPIRITMNG